MTDDEIAEIRAAHATRDERLSGLPSVLDRGAAIRALSVALESHQTVSDLLDVLAASRANEAAWQEAAADLTNRLFESEQRTEALHSLVCNADGYDKSIVRGLALYVRRTASDGFYKDLAQRVIDAETKASAVSRCNEAHPFPDARAALDGAAAQTPQESSDAEVG